MCDGNVLLEGGLGFVVFVVPIVSVWECWVLRWLLHGVLCEWVVGLLVEGVLSLCVLCEGVLWLL